MLLLFILIGILFLLEILISRFPLKAEVSAFLVILDIVIMILFWIVLGWKYTSGVVKF